MQNIEKGSIKEWLGEVESKGFKEKNSRLWKRAHLYASKPRRQRVSVNLDRLDRIAKEGDYILIPGKVLSTGSISKRFTVSAIEYSGSAAEKLSKAGCRHVPVREMLSRKEVRLVI